MSKGVRVDKKSSIDFRNYFLILTFIGDGYVLINHGQVNAGYAVVPGIWTMICSYVGWGIAYGTFAGGIFSVLLPEHLLVVLCLGIAFGAVAGVVFGKRKLSM